MVEDEDPAAGDLVGGGGMPTIRTTKRSSGHAAASPAEPDDDKDTVIPSADRSRSRPIGAVAGGNPVSGRAAETRRQALPRQRQHYWVARAGSRRTGG